MHSEANTSNIFIFQLYIYYRQSTASFFLVLPRIWNKPCPGFGRSTASFFLQAVYSIVLSSKSKQRISVYSIVLSTGSLQHRSFKQIETANFSLQHRSFYRQSTASFFQANRNSEFLHGTAFNSTALCLCANQKSWLRWVRPVRVRP